LKKPGTESRSARCSSLYQRLNSASCSAGTSDHTMSSAVPFVLAIRRSFRERLQASLVFVHRVHASCTTHPGSHDRLFVQPHGITPYYVINAEIARRIWPLDVRVPTVIHLLPGHRQQWRILLDDGFRLPHERVALCRIGLAVDLRHEGLEGGIVPMRVIL